MKSLLPWLPLLWSLPLAAAFEPPLPPVERAPVLTLESVLEAAVRSFPVLLAAESRREAAAGERLAAEGGFDTTMKMRTNWSIAGLYENRNYDVSIEQPTGLWGTTFFGGWRRGSGDYPIYEGKSVTADSGEFRAGFTVPLWRNGPIDRRRAGLAQAELGQLIADHDYDAALLDVQRLASLRYWDWVAAGRRLAIARSLLAVAEQRDLGLRARIEHGDAAAIEATDNRRAILERRERLVTAERLLEQSSILLSLYWRDVEGKPRLPEMGQLPDGFPEPDPRPPLDTENAIEQALHTRPELRKLEQQRKQAEIEREWARNQQAPGVDLSVMGARDLGYAGSKLANREEFYAGLSIDLPLQRRVAQGRTQTASAQVQRIDTEYRLAADRIAAEVKDALSALRAAERRVGLARQQREAARQLEEGERARFDLGDSNLLFVNLRELAAGDAALSEAEALNAFFKAKADYRAAVGTMDGIQGQGE